MDRLTDATENITFPCRLSDNFTARGSTVRKGYDTMFDKSTLLFSRRFSSLFSNFQALKNVIKSCVQMIVSFINDI